MAQVQEVIPPHLGSGPVLKALSQNMGFLPIIDRTLSVDPRRGGPTPGETVAGMGACRVQGLWALSRLAPLAAAAPVRRTLVPHEAAQAWHDDHRGDPLEAIWKVGPAAVPGAVPAPWRQTFDVRVAPSPDETTSVTVCGRSTAQDTAAAAGRRGAEARAAAPAMALIPVRLVPGPSPEHRPDVNQVTGGLAVRADGRVPRLWAAQDGNQADVSTAVADGLKVTDRGGRPDVRGVGAGQVATQDHLVAIIPHPGRLLAPRPGSAGSQRPREAWGLTHPVEDRLPRREAAGHEGWSGGFRRRSGRVAAAGRQDPGAVPIWCTPRWRAEQPAHRERRLQQTPACLEGLPTRLGKRTVTSPEASAPALDATVRRSHTGDWRTDRRVATGMTRQPSRGRGRPAAEAPSDAVSEGHWTGAGPWLPEAIATATWLGGSVPVLTHDPSLTTARALRVSQAPDHPAQPCPWRQGAGIVAPVRLKTPPRLQAVFVVGGLVRPLLTRVAREAAGGPPAASP